MLPLNSFVEFSPAAELGIALLLGLGFGFALERAGFGSARKLTAVFYLWDMAVVKVMFTAIVTTMAGLFLLSAARLDGPVRALPRAHELRRAGAGRPDLRRRLHRRRLLPGHLAVGGSHRPQGRHRCSFSACSAA